MRSTHKLTRNSNCNCQNSGRPPIIEIRKLKKGQEVHKEASCYIIVAVKKGQINYFPDNYIIPLNISTEQLLLIPSGQTYSMHALETTTLICFRIEHKNTLCKCHPIDEFHKEEGDVEIVKAGTLVIRKPLDAYIKALEANIQDGIRCNAFHNIKVQELFYILRIYYNTQELKTFLFPVLSHDIDFSNMVLKAAVTTNTISGLAMAASMSISGFKKKFKTTFGNIPPYNWLQQQKVQRIYLKITMGNKTMKEISEEEGFSSPSAFSHYCRRNLIGKYALGNKKDRE